MPISAIRLEAGRSGRGYHAGCSPPTAVRLQLHALVYNLGILRTLATPEPIRDWSLTSLKEKLIKIGAKVVKAWPLRRLPPLKKFKHKPKAELLLAQLCVGISGG
jgi:hypothetical protein